MVRTLFTSFTVRITLPSPLVRFWKEPFLHIDIFFVYLDSCIFDDNIGDKNYTLFSNETWLITRRCGQIQVTCNSGVWSEDISCPKLNTNTLVFKTPTTQHTYNGKFIHFNKHKCL